MRMGKKIPYIFEFKLTISLTVSVLVPLHFVESTHGAFTSCATNNELEEKEKE